MKNKLTKILCLALTLLLLCGCAGQTAGPANPAANGAAGPAQTGPADQGGEEIEYELALTAEFLELPEGMAHATAQCREGYRIWLGGAADSGAVMGWVSLDGGGSGLAAMPEGCDFLYALCTAGENVAALAGSLPAFYEDAQGQIVDIGEPEGRLELLVFDGTELVSETELAGRYGSIFHSMLELDGSFYILCQGSLIKLSPDGAELARFEHGEHNVLMLAMRVYGGELVAAARDLNSFGTRFYRLDTESLALNSEEFIPETIISGMGMVNDTLVVDTGAELVALDPDFQFGDPVFKWAELFTSGGYQEIDELVGGYLFFDPYQTQVCCARWKQARVRKTVIMAADIFYGEAQTLAGDFNRAQDEYYVEVKTYNSYNDDELMRLQTEIGGGNWPDLFAFENPRTLAEMRDEKALENLYDYLDADTELSAQDLMPQLLGVMERRGALYWMPWKFWVYTLIAPESLVGGPGISVEDTLRTARENGLAPIEQWITREELLSRYSAAAIRQFVDWNSGTCSFDSEEFVHILRLCGEMLKSADVDRGEAYIGPNDPALLANYILTSPVNLAGLRASFGGDYCFAGYPGAQGSGSLFHIPLRLAITAGAQEKQGAWEFIKFALSEREQLAVGSAGRGFSPNADVFERELDTLLREGATNILGETREITEDDARKLRELIDGARLLMDADPTLEKIISDCAAAYFAGDKSAEDTAEDIQGRASIYVAERG